MATALAAPPATVARPSSLIGRLDPRARLLLVLGALLAVLSEPAGSLSPYPPYLALTLAVLVLARVPIMFLVRRLAAVAPIVLLAAALLVLAGAHVDAADRALSMVMRSFAAVALVCVLAATERMSGILWAMSALGMPRLFTTLSAFMYRYAMIMGDEAVRTERARRSRTPGAPGSRSPATWLNTQRRRLRTVGGQAALIFLRGWKRSRNVHAAMLARGFTGHFPFAQPGRLGTLDVIIATTVAGAFAGVRLLWP